MRAREPRARVRAVPSRSRTAKIRPFFADHYRGTTVAPGEGRMSRQGTSIEKRTVCYAVFSAFIACAACGGSGDAFSEPAAVALADVPAKYAAALCSAYQRCLGQEIYALFANGSDCAAQTEQKIRNGEFSLFQGLIDAGQLRYDGTKVEACLAAIDAQTCNTLNVRPLPECEAALDGTVEVN